MKKGSSLDYHETIDHRVFYKEDPSKPSGYYAYKDINSHARDYFPGGNFSSTLKESFKHILKGESISSTLSAQQKKFIYTLFYQLFAIEGARDPATYLTIPMAIEYLSMLEVTNQAHNIVLSEGYGKNEGLIPICFYEAMQALSYMGDIIFESLTSIRYSHAYDGTSGKFRSTAWDKVKTKTSNLFNGWKTAFAIDNDFNTILHKLLQLSQEWYGFMPRMHELSNIQLFQGLGMQAQDAEYDGNCFFHALNRLLHDLGRSTFSDGVAITPNLLRERAANDIEVRDPEMAARVMQNGRWLDLIFDDYNDENAIAGVLGRLLQVNIVLVPAGLNQDAIANIAEGDVHIGDADHPNNTIYIGNINNTHFVSLTGTTDNEIFQKLQQAITDKIAAEQQLEQLVQDVQPGLSTMNTLAAALTDIDDREANEESYSSDEYQEESDEDASSETENDNQDDEESDEYADNDDQVYFVTEIIYNNSNVYGDYFSSIFSNKETFHDQEITKLVNSFPFTPVMFGTKDIESQPIIIVADELAGLSYEQFNNLLGILYNWFGSNFHFDQ